MKTKHLAAGVTVALVVAMIAYVTVAQPGPGRRPGGRGKPGGMEWSEIKSTPMGATDAEKKALAVLDDMFKTQRQGMQNVPTDDGRLLRLLAETSGAKHIVEVGTSNGYSGIWFCLALRTTGGKLTTFEIDPKRADMAKANFKRAGVDDLVTLVLGNAHDEVGKVKGPIDILFLDADKEGYVDYLTKLLPQVRSGGLIIAHNTNPHQLDAKYFKAITTNPKLETIFVNLHATGVGLTLKKR